MSMFLLRHHIRARVPQTVVTGVLLVIESHPWADLQRMGLIPLALHIQAHALQNPEDVTWS